jgi:translation initiation factor 5
MATVNVNRSVCDTFYRYKMPRILAKVEGKGNGVKTVIANMGDVAKAIGRPPSYPTKYFGCELGAQVFCDQKNDRFVVNGSHDANKLQNLLDGFIKRFVLCPSCDNPETVLTVHQKKGVIGQSCKACGHHGSVDSRHRLSAFILKNPPLSKVAQAAKNGGRKNRKETGGSVESNGSSHDGEDSFDSGANVGCTTHDDDDDDWAVDVSETAVKQRMKELGEGVRQFADVGVAPEKDRIDEFFSSVKAMLEDGRLLNENGLLRSGVDKELFSLAVKLEIRDKATLVLAEVLLTASLLKELKTFRVVFLRFCHDCPKAQRYLLSGVEQVLALHEHLIPRVPNIFKSLYDLDLVEEEAFLEWEKKSCKKNAHAAEVRSKAAAFLTWLREASEEESSSDHDGSDVEIAYDDRAVAPHVERVEKDKGIAAVADEELDIDAI